MLLMGAEDFNYFPYSLIRQPDKGLILSNMFNTLRELQVVCVSLQYRHHYDGRLDREISEQLTAVRTSTKVQHLTPSALRRGLQCILYQIEPEHLTELRPLTPDEQGALDLAREIINTIAGYYADQVSEKAGDRWSID